MTTLALPRGRQAGSLLFKDEATYGTAPATGDYQPMPFYTEGLGASDPLQSDPIIGADEHNARDSTKPAPGLLSHAGEVVFPMCLANLGHVLRYALGNPTTTGAGADKTHTFASGAETLPSASIQVPKKSNVVMVNEGCVLSSLGLSFSRQAGFRQVTTSWIGRNDRVVTAALGDEADVLGLEQIAGTIATVSIDGTAVGHVMSGQLTFNTGAAGLDSVTGDGAISAVLLENDATLEGQIVTRFTDKTYYDLAVARAPKAMVITFEISATRLLQITMPAATIGRVPLAPITGPGGMEGTLPFRAAQTDAAAMVSVVLKNGVTGYT